MSTVREVLFEPTNFFRRLPPRGSRTSNTLVFALVCLLIPLFLALLTAPCDPLAVGDPSRTLTNLSRGRGAAVLMVVFPLLVVLGLYIGAGILHIFVLIFESHRGTGFEATFLVNAYASFVGLLSWIPILGYVASFYALYRVFVGIRKMHGTTPVGLLP